MARRLIAQKVSNQKKRRKGVHSKNASKGRKGWKKLSRGQGK